MYGFRKEIERNPYECFQKVRALGFEKIQLDGCRGRDPEEIADAIRQAGLVVDSMHMKHHLFISDVDEIMRQGELFGCHEVYLKYIEDEFQVEYGYKFTKYALLRAAEQLIASGFEVGLHSPEYDFNTLVDGKRVMDYLCNETDGVAIHPEPDTYWLTVAGIDPLSYCQGYAGQILTMHLKDIDTSCDLMDMDANLRPCGEGSVDFESLMRWGYENGVRSFAIEQDQSHGDIYEDFAHSLKYLRGIEEKIDTTE